MQNIDGCLWHQRAKGWKIAMASPLSWHGSVNPENWASQHSWWALGSQGAGCGGGAAVPVLSSQIDVLILIILRQDVWFFLLCLRLGSQIYFPPREELGIQEPEARGGSN